MMVVVADRDAESFLGFVLLDDEPIQVALDIARSQLELEDGMRLLLVRQVLPRSPLDLPAPAWQSWRERTPEDVAAAARVLADLARSLSCFIRHVRASRKRKHAKPWHASRIGTLSDQFRFDRFQSCRQLPAEFSSSWAARGFLGQRPSRFRISNGDEIVLNFDEPIAVGCIVCGHWLEFVDPAFHEQGLH